MTERRTLPISISVSGRGSPLVKVTVTVNGKLYRNLPPPFGGDGTVPPNDIVYSYNADLELTEEDGVNFDGKNVIKVFSESLSSFDTNILNIDLGKEEAECFIPIRNFKPNIPGGEGYKTQLQIIFADKPKDGKECRQITVPYPKNDLTAEVIKSAVGNSVEFGQVKCEVDITPYGYIRYYAPNKEVGRQVITRLATLSAGRIVTEPEDSFRASERKRVFESLTGYPTRAIIFIFEEGKEPRCKRFNLK
jgi:hypothetical protein